MRFSTVRSKDDLVRLVKRAGILPCFVNELEGFSAEEHIAPEYWFPEEGEGFWEWKGPVIRDSGCAYGKLFKGRASFMTLEYYREFANYRRNGYDFDALVDEGLARYRDIDVYNKLSEAGSILSTDLMHMCDMKTFNDYEESIDFQFAKLHIEKDNEWVGKRIDKIDVPLGSQAIMIRRNGKSLAARGKSLIKANDDLILNVPAYYPSGTEEVSEVSEG